ncbi:class I SAM-dependent methyltransferase [Desulfococcaceae bacterium OttesenSCG-928-F15]|nr:class I SAM-dependent methyltransferase [Desulfococcaceae bacterium OttesenSCG-928-F15]
MSFYDKKSTINEIRERFDKDVERFSDLESGQASTMDAGLVLELISQAASRARPQISRVLDIGCGAGNNTLKLLQLAAPFDVDLLDLSLPMLLRARERIAKENAGEIRIFQGDFREIDLEKESYDVILAAAVFHHLRDDEDWEKTFAKIYTLTAPGGSVWISDLVSHDNPEIEKLMRERYGDYLCSLGGPEYRDNVFAYIEKEDSPRSVSYQTDLLRKVGFETVELLHKNGCFAAFGAVRKK